MASSTGIDWQIESARVTAFLNDQLDPDRLEEWVNKLSENLPLQVTKTPSSFSSISTRSNQILNVEWDGNSNRFNASVSASPQLGESTIAPISEVSSVITAFVDSIPKILKPGLINRIALGVVLNHEVADEAQGLQILGPYLEGRVTIASLSTDFLYRVNEPAMSESINDLYINRLRTWSVGSVRILQYDLGHSNSQARIVSSSPIAIRLELDINSDASKPLEVDDAQYGLLLSELEKIALGIAGVGDACPQA